MEGREGKTRGEEGKGRERENRDGGEREKLGE